VVLVALPIVMVLTLAPVPAFMAPVDPESKARAFVPSEVTASAPAEVRAAAVMVPAVKLPDASRRAMEPAVFAPEAGVQVGAAPPAPVSTEPAAPAGSMAVMPVFDW